MNALDFIKKYFIEHKNELTHNYPGLSEKKLAEEFLLFSGRALDEEYFPDESDVFWRKLSEGIPLEYINHNSFFYRSNFFVNENVLIPRSETEILVEDSISFINKNYHPDYAVAEVGTGSFCIGLSIAIDVKDKIKLWGGDISEEALEVSKLNYFRLQNKINPQTQIQLAQSDRLKATDKKFDFIVSNPPYINKDKDREGVHHQADRYEPHVALYLRDSEYDAWFDEFFRDIAQKLNEGGAFFMEGHEDSLLHLQEIAMKYFQKVIVKQDYTGRNRFLHAFI